MPAHVQHSAPVSARAGESWGRMGGGGVIGGRTVRRRDVREERSDGRRAFYSAPNSALSVSTVKGRATDPGKQPGATRRPHPVVKDNRKLR